MDRVRALGRGTRSKNSRLLLYYISHPQLEVPRCARYAYGEANWDSAECFYSESHENHA